MSILNELVSKIEDVDLRERISAEIGLLSKQKKFGLVFEEHLPECTPLYGLPVKKGTRVALKTGKVSDVYLVQRITGNTATCIKKDDGKTSDYAVGDLVRVAEFGDPIYPYLKPIDSVCNAPDSDLWHTLIEADNYHALQLLEYLYAGKVDCIYIDPPYNTGARDWKYNNDYVDTTDTYRHSKWLSMMQKRLKIAKKILNPQSSVLIVTIDEKEYLHLGCLLEEMFPEASIQMVSTVINPSGVARGSDFARTDEYLFFVKLGSSMPAILPLTLEWMSAANPKLSSQPYWRTLRRRGSHDLRKDAPNMFYPIFIENDSGKIIGCGDAMPVDEHPDFKSISKGTRVTIYPMKPNFVEGNWQLSQAEMQSRLKEGYVRCVAKNQYGWIPTYLAKGEIAKVVNGTYTVMGRGGANNEVQLAGEEGCKHFTPGTQWRIRSHNARECGSVILSTMLGMKKFSFPKSLYAVHDAIRFFVANNPNALIVDFFAGSGTTLHAVNLLNAEDGGHRRCVLVTNNEVSDEESKSLTKRGYHPGDEEWEKLGIARYVTWPRTVCSIEGHDVNGNPLKGNYLGSDIPLSDGFKANAIYFKLGFLNKDSVAMGRQFRELLSILWMKSGSFGKCPKRREKEIPDMLILPENRFAVLTNEDQYVTFSAELKKNPEIETVYIITDSEMGYRQMAVGINVKQTYQLYKDYLDNFRINVVRRDEK